MKDLTPLANRKKKELVKDPLAFVDSVARPDLPVLEVMLSQPDKSGQVARLFIGATESMPARALGYLASAVRVGQLTGVEQVQVVSVGTLGAHVNGVDRLAVHQQFDRFARVGLHIIERVVPDMADKLAFVEDTPDGLPAVAELTPLMSEVIDGDAELRHKLLNRGSKHGGDFKAYAAAHLAYQDTRGLELAPVRGVEPVTAEQSVAIGCLQEKYFFSARQAARQLLDECQIMPSAQVFSLHASAPYFVSEGEGQLLDDAIAKRGIDFDSGLSYSVQRDLNHLRLFTDIGEHHA